MRRAQAGSMIIFLLAFLCSLANCAGRETRKEGGTMSQFMTLGNRYDNVVFSDFTSTLALTREHPGMMNACRKAAMSRLIKKRMYKEVGLESTGIEHAGTTLCVKGKITGVRLVSKSARFWGGENAGRAYLNLTLTLIDGSSNRVVRVEKLSTQKDPFGASRSGGGTDSSLAEEMGEIVAEYIMAVAPGTGGAQTSRERRQQSTINRVDH